MIKLYNSPYELHESIADTYNNLSAPVTSGLGAIGGAAVGAGSSYAAYKIAKDKLLKQLEACTDSKCRDDIQEQISRLNQTMATIGTGATLGSAAIGGGLSAIAKYDGTPVPVVQPTINPDDLTYAVANGMMAVQGASQPDEAPVDRSMIGTVYNDYMLPMAPFAAMSAVPYAGQKGFTYTKPVIAHGYKTAKNLPAAYTMMKGGTIDPSLWKAAKATYKTNIAAAKALMDTDPDAAKQAVIAAKDALKLAPKFANAASKLSKVKSALGFAPRLLRAASLLAKVV